MTSKELRNNKAIDSLQGKSKSSLSNASSQRRTLTPLQPPSGLIVTSIHSTEQYHPAVDSEDQLQTAGGRQRSSPEIGRHLRSNKKSTGGSTTGHGTKGGRTVLEVHIESATSPASHFGQDDQQIDIRDKAGSPEYGQL